MRCALLALAWLVAGMPASAARAVRDAAARIQLDIFLDAPVRDAGSPAPLASHLSENPLELGDLSPGLDLPGDRVRRALLSGQPADYLRELRRSGQQAPADDEIAQGYVQEALDRERADAIYFQQARGRQQQLREEKFRAAARRIAQVASVDYFHARWQDKRDALIALGVGEASGRPIDKAQPAQIGAVFKYYYRNLVDPGN